MKTYRNVKRAYEGFKKENNGYYFSRWIYIHKYSILQEKESGRFAVLSIIFFLAAIILSNKNWTAFEQSTRNSQSETRTSQWTPPLPPSPHPHFLCIRALTWDFGLQKCIEILPRRKKRFKSRQNIKCATIQSSKCVWALCALIPPITICTIQSMDVNHYGLRIWRTLFL